MRVFLIHGMGRTSASMALFGRRLRSAGHDVDAFGYFVSRDPLDVIAARFRAFVEARRRGAPFAVIGHSLGNVITRMVLPLDGLERLVMLAPPNQPPVIAQALESNPVFKALTRDAGRKLNSPDFYATLAVPTVPTLVVAGNRGPLASWLPFRGEPSDGLVRVVETELPGAAHVVVPAIHTFIMNDGQVTRMTLRFLDDSNALPEGVRAVETPRPPR